jgi:putative transposase
MTHEEKINALDAVLQPVIEKGFDGIGDVFAALLNTAMLIERERHLNADAYERTEERRGHANGFKPRFLRRRCPERQRRWMPSWKSGATRRRTSP